MDYRVAVYALLVILFCGRVVAAQTTDSPVVPGFTVGSVESSDGLEIVYEFGGDGDTALVFVHCWTCDRGFWREQLPTFSEAGYRVVALDLGGHGASSTGRDTWTMDAFGSDVAAVVHKLDLHNVIIVGHSMGGTVTLEAANRIDERVKGIVLVDSFRDPEERMSEQEINDFVGALKADFRGTTDRMVRQYMFAPGTDSVFIDHIADHMASFDPSIGIEAIEQYFRANYTEALRSLEVPVKAINAGYVPTNLESMRRHGIDVAILPDVGHFLILEQPGRFNELLVEALSTM